MKFLLISCLPVLIMASPVFEIVRQKRGDGANASTSTAPITTTAASIDVKANLEKYDDQLKSFKQSYKDKILTPLKEIIHNASFFIETLDNVVATQSASGNVDTNLNKIELSLEGSKDELELMREDLKTQVQALTNLAHESENLSAEGESMIIGLTKEQVELEKQIVESEKALAQVLVDLNGTETQLNESKVALEDTEKKMKEKESQMKEKTKDLTEESKTCLTKRGNIFGNKGFFDKLGGKRSVKPKAMEEKLRKRGFFDDIGNAFKEVGKDIVKGVEKAVDVVHEAVCDVANKKDIEDAYQSYNHVKSELETTKKSFNEKKTLVEKLATKKQDLITSINTINDKKNSSALFIELVKNETSLANNVQSNLKKHQKEISDLQVKLEAFTKSVEIDLLRQGIEVVADVAAGLSEGALDSEDTEEEKEKLDKEIKKLKKKKKQDKKDEE